ncbi:MAG: tRNA (guanine-N1)-methyltransferase [Flavobacteriaceae bacterium]|nr:tRNA (guanine-N1)-methyltransferase [Flavobacteriaceae bacterium]
MMKFQAKTLYLIIALISISQAGLQAQNEEDNLSLNDGTIDNQFEFVIQRSNNYQEYKVVKKNWLYTLKAHTIDSLNAVREDLVSTQKVVDQQEKEIQSLKEDLNNTTETLNQTNLEKDSMSLFGIQMSKGGYNVLMWSIIGILLILLLFFIYKFKNSNAITRQARLSLAETEEEFEEHRRIALEREQKVRRQLQDEINKQKKS